MISDPYTQYLIGSVALPEGPMNSVLSICHSVQPSVTLLSQDCFLTFFLVLSKKLRFNKYKK